MTKSLHDMSSMPNQRSSLHVQKHDVGAIACSLDWPCLGWQGY